MSKFKFQKMEIINIVRQLRDDLPFLTALTDQCLENMPTAYADRYIEERYFLDIYKKPFYRMIDQRKRQTLYFLTRKEMYDYIYSIRSYVNTNNIRHIYREEGFESIKGFKHNGAT